LPATVLLSRLPPAMQNTVVLVTRVSGRSSLTTRANMRGSAPDRGALSSREDTGSRDLSVSANGRQEVR